MKGFGISLIHPSPTPAISSYTGYFTTALEPWYFKIQPLSHSKERGKKATAGQNYGALQICTSSQVTGGTG